MARRVSTWPSGRRAPASAARPARTQTKTVQRSRAQAQSRTGSGRFTKP